MARPKLSVLIKGRNGLIHMGLIPFSKKKKTKESSLQWILSKIHMTSEENNNWANYLYQQKWQPIQYHSYCLCITASMWIWVSLSIYNHEMSTIYVAGCVCRFPPVVWLRLLIWFFLSSVRNPSITIDQLCVWLWCMRSTLLIKRIESYIKDWWFYIVL